MFLTGTRADFGKLQPLMRAVSKSNKYECSIFVTGSHMLSQYGQTYLEVVTAGFKKIFTLMNQYPGEPMELILANTVSGLSRHIAEHKPDLIIVHGDRVEALAGAIAGSLAHVLVGHIEGGERSGTIDEVIRHAVTKMSHLHFVANDEHAKRVRQMGEKPQSIKITGSADIDVMLSDDLPSLEDTFRHYDIGFDNYAIAIFHPVTTERRQFKTSAESFVSALLASGDNFVVINPNNDPGSEYIFNSYERLIGNDKIKRFPSVRFESFLTLLKNSSYMVGNSSAGLREAPVYGVPTIDVGSRQDQRYQYESIINCGYEKQAIIQSIETAKGLTHISPSTDFGTGNGTELFMKALNDPKLWLTKVQKVFLDADE